ncbi:sensor histidine kinase regulating citrate/malate metabolism [Streptomyces sp. 846.5]|nr:sensor histidine kinase [Streptomyces sp. 846.5]TDU02749.1 sensor histidine kinase regulating citrate/malate metabolism [Streptomyces sp. 846.5]
MSPPPPPPPPPRQRPRPARSLAGQLFAVQVLIVVLVVAAGAVLAYWLISDRTETSAKRQVTSVARAVADAPTVRQAMLSTDPTAVLQPYAERVRVDSGVDFVTIMDTHGIRLAHRDPAQIGKPFLGHYLPALAGRTFTETYTGTLGPSVRVVTPVLDEHGKVVAVVSVGLTLQSISEQLTGPVVTLVLVAVSALLLGALGSWLANRRLRRHTHGMGPAELSHLYEYHQATLHSVREGLLLLDRGGTVLLCNDAARELLALDGEVEGRQLGDLGLPEPLCAAIAGQDALRDEVHLTAERVVVVNTQLLLGMSARKGPLTAGSRGGTGGRPPENWSTSAIGTGPALGTVVTLRDHTELQALSGELDSVRGFADALGAQAHEAANRLHAVVSLIELGRHRQAVEFATAELELAQQLTDRVVGAVSEPVLAALLLGKAAQAAERGVELTLTEDSLIDDSLAGAVGARDLVTLLGNLIDNAMDAAIEGAAESPRPPEVTVTARNGSGELLLRVADTGRGIDPDAVEKVFRRGWSTKHSGRGLGLALVAQTARRNGGTVVAESPAGAGAVLTVRIPLQRTAEVPG